MKHNILLAFSFAKRDFKERYVGTGLGRFWYIISPLVMIFIFSGLMKMKLDEDHLINYLHWLDNAKDFEVVGIVGDIFVGICKLESEIKFTEKKK